MSELKPCPFCGEIQELIENPPYIYCMGCGAKSTYWQTRPIEDAQSTEIKSLKAKVAELEERIEEWKLEYLEEIDQSFLPCNTEYIPFDYSGMEAHEVIGAMGDRIKELFGSNKSLEAANARMREALEDIRNSGGRNLYSEDAYDFIDIAREALKGEG